MTTNYVEHNARVFYKGEGHCENRTYGAMKMQ